MSPTQGVIACFPQISESAAELSSHFYLGVLDKHFQQTVGKVIFAFFKWQTKLLQMPGTPFPLRLTKCHVI